MHLQRRLPAGHGLLSRNVLGHRRVQPEAGAASLASLRDPVAMYSCKAILLGELRDVHPGGHVRVLYRVATSAVT